MCQVVSVEYACSMASGLEMLTHSPSGDFTPSIDNVGRLIFTRWGHLQLDQQADGDIEYNAGYGTFNYADETVNSLKSDNYPNEIEVFFSASWWQKRPTGTPSMGKYKPTRLQCF